MSFGFPNSNSGLVFNQSTFDSDNMPVFTFWTWMYKIAGEAYGPFLRKVSGGYLSIDFDSDDNLFFYRITSGTEHSALTNTSPFATDNKWYFWALVVPALGTNPSFYFGDLDTPATEPGGYGSRTSGTGSITSDAAADLVIGNSNALVNPIASYLDRFGIYKGAMTQTQLREIQYRYMPILQHSLVCFCGLHGTSSCPDFSGAGNAPSTIQGVNIQDPAPLISPFGVDVEVPYAVAAAAGGVVPQAYQIMRG